MKKVSILSMIVLGLVNLVAAQGNLPDFKIYGVKINVPNIEKAIEFYSGAMGFKVEKIDFQLREAFISSGDSRKIILRESPERLFPNRGEYSCISFAMEVNNLDNAWRMLGGSVKFFENEKRKEVHGKSLHYYDPFGNRFELFEIWFAGIRPTYEQRLYIVGHYVPDLQKGIEFYITKFGLSAQDFIVRGQDSIALYHADESLVFVLHLNRKDFGLRRSVNGKNAANLVFSTKNLSQARVYLKKIGIETSKPMPSLGWQFASFKDNFGIRVDLIEPRK